MTASSLDDAHATTRRITTLSVGTATILIVMKAFALGASGSVTFQFDRRGELTYPAAVGSEDTVMEAAIEAGAQDVESDEDRHVVYTAFEDFAEVATALEGALGEPKSSKIVWRPKNTTAVTGDAVATLMKLLATAMPLQTGSVPVGDVPLVRDNLTAVRRQLGYLPQRFEVMGWSTVRRNVEYAAWAHGLPSREAGERADRALVLLGLSDRAGSRARALRWSWRIRA